MAVTRLFPIKSNTLYSDTPFKNAGKDQIIELTSDKLDLSRILMSFDLNQVSSSVSGKSNWSSNLILYTANESGLPEQYTIKSYRTFSSWNEGTGNYLNSPETIEASTWRYADVESEQLWTGVSGSITSYNPSSSGGGNWYASPSASISINKLTEKDLRLDITNIITSLLTGSGSGIILKLDTDLESNYNEEINVKYFSEDTNTIYKPVLELRYDDSQYNATSNIITDFDIFISILNGFTTLSLNDTVIFKLGIRKLFPQKTYDTVYSPVNILNITSGSYWELKDVGTGEVIISGSGDNTKISNTGNVNYFTFNTHNLYKHRFYSFDIFIKVGSAIKKFSPKYVFNIK